MAISLDDITVGCRWALTQQHDGSGYAFLLWQTGTNGEIETFSGAGATPSAAAADCLKDM